MESECLSNENDPGVLVAVLAYGFLTPIALAGHVIQSTRLAWDTAGVFCKP